VLLGASEKAGHVAAPDPTGGRTVRSTASYLDHSGGYHDTIFNRRHQGTHSYICVLRDGASLLQGDVFY
jgi:hypothetical protein